MEHIEESALQYMYFVGDDLVVHIELIEEINKRIEIWKWTLEAYDFCLSRSKMIYIWDVGY